MALRKRWGVVSAVLALSLSCAKPAPYYAPAESDQTRFLSPCDRFCVGGLDCVEGLCTRTCSPDRDAGSACPSWMPGAECRPGSSSESPAVCDVSCSGSADCVPLGAGYACESGYCRAPAPTTLDCDSYRNHVAEERVTVRLRNARASTIVVQREPYGCNDEPHLVRAFTRGQEVRLESPQSCGLRFCQDEQDLTGYLEDCPAICTQASLVPLEPGAELVAGRFGSQFIEHRTPTALPMPAECTPLQLEKSCTSEARLPAGAYEFIAKAQTECTPTTDAGVTFASCEGGESTASTIIDLPAREVTLVFE